MHLTAVYYNRISINGISLKSIRMHQCNAQQSGTKEHQSKGEQGATWQLFLAVNNQFCLSAYQHYNVKIMAYWSLPLLTKKSTQLGPSSFTFDGVPLSLSSLPDRPPFSDSLASLFSLRMALSLSWMSSFLCSMASRAELSESSWRSRAEYSENNHLMYRIMQKKEGHHLQGFRVK